MPALRARSGVSSDSFAAGSCVGAEVASLAANHVQRFNMKPRVAFVSHSDFGSYDTDSSRKMRRATALLKEKHPEIEADGEMQGDTALSAAARKLVLPHSNLEGDANILIMPNLDTANVAYQMIKTLADALPVGPILIGPARPAHILTPGVTARGGLNMTAVAAVEAQERAGRQQPSLFGSAGEDRRFRLRQRSCAMDLIV